MATRAPRAPAKAAKAAKPKAKRVGRKAHATIVARAGAKARSQAPEPGSVFDRYWAALAARDATTMAACYAPEATFQDEVFRLDGAGAGAMWAMLFEGAADLRITTGPLTSHGDRAFGTWEAWYTFSATGRQVHNVIRSEFKSEGGAIVQQRDRFPFWRWSRQALGPVGALLGWTPLVRRKVRKQAKARLAAWRGMQAT